jgi:cytochrome c oxidase assembly protein subunit 11
MNRENKNTAVRLAAVSLLMFGFGYLLVPLYDVICEVTGFNGKTGVISVSRANNMETDHARLVTVQFDTNVNSKLPWRFSANARSVRVRPGEIGVATFTVTNLDSRTITGQAIPSVTPSRGSIYFNKTECFCFTQQQLLPGEQKEMTVRFVIDPELPATINTLLLSYTFLPAPGTAAALSEGEQIIASRTEMDGRRL